MYKQKNNLAAVVFLFAILSSVVLGQEEVTDRNVFQLSLEELMNVVITPSRTPRFADNVTQKIDVINTKEIQQTVSGNRNICEVIGRLPGASVSVLSRNDANWGTYGGIGPKYSTYMLQGVPLDAFVDPMSLDLNAIDHIEVQRGPASVFYPNFLSQDFAGNQTPLAGTINLILKEKIGKTQTSILTSYGSYNTLNGQIFHQENIERLHFFLGTSYEISDYTNYGTSGSWLNIKKDPEYRKTKVYGGLTYFVDEEEKQKLTLFLQETWHDGDKGRVYQNFDNQYGTLNTGYSIAFNEELSMQSHFGIRSYDRTWQESIFGTIDTLKSNAGVNQLIIPVDISLSWAHGKSNILSVGSDYQKAEYYTWADPKLGYRVYGNKSFATQLGIYAQEEWSPADQFVLRGGLRFAHIKNVIELSNGFTPVNNSDSWDKILWSFGSRYSVNKIVALYANVGSSFATPALKSVGGTIPISAKGFVGRDGQLPNPNLKPESGIGTDLGIDIKLPDNINIGVRFFYTNIQDAIVDNVVSQNPSQSQSINTGSSISTGGEIGLSQRWAEGFSWFANGTYLKSNTINDLNNDQNDVEIPFSPNVILNGGFSYTFPMGLTISPSLSYNGGFYDGASKTSRNLFKPGVVLNVYVEQYLAKGDVYTLDCFVQLYNITNNDFEMPWQFKNPGFSAMFGIKATF